MLVVMLVRAIDACVRAGVLTYFLARRAPWMRKKRSTCGPPPGSGTRLRLRRSVRPGMFVP